jgi:hypothetical protein
LLKKALLKKYEDFKIDLDDEIFRFNLVFIRIISSRCDELIHLNEIKFSVRCSDGTDTSQFQFLFYSIISCFHGYHVDLSKFYPMLIQQMAECFRIIKFDHLLKQKLISDMRVGKALKYLKKIF